jgi:hypothetical protein
MKFSIRIANVYSDILEETRKEIVIVKDRKTYIGALFFKKDADETVKKVFERVDFEGTAAEAMVIAYNMMKEHGLTKKDDKTLKTMLHWQHVNGLTNECILAGYHYKTDTELLASGELTA